MLDVFGAYRGAKVLLTGHTGFKGAWLAKWLVSIGAEVVGYSLPADSDQSLYHALKLDDQLESIVGDLRDYKKLSQLIARVRPDFVFHLAATIPCKKIVQGSYGNVFI